MRYFHEFSKFQRKTDSSILLLVVKNSRNSPQIWRPTRHCNNQASQQDHRNSFFRFHNFSSTVPYGTPSGMSWLFMINKLWTNPYRHWATSLNEHQSYRTRHNRRNLRFLYIRHFPFLAVGKVENHLWWRHRVYWIGHLEYPWNLSNVHLRFKRVWPKVNSRQSERLYKSGRFWAKPACWSTWIFKIGLCYT